MIESPGVLADWWCRDEAELAAELKRLDAEIEDEQLLDAEGDFPATLAPPSRPHRGDDEDEDEEVRYSVQLYKAVTRKFYFGGVFLPSLPSVSFPSFSTPFFFLFLPRLVGAPQIQLRGLGRSTVGCPQRGTRTTFAATRHVPFALNTPKLCLRPSTM